MYDRYTCPNFSKDSRLEGKKGPTKIEQILKEGQKDQNHGKIICILYGFPCEMDFSHNCSLHEGKSELCEKRGQKDKNPTKMRVKILIMQKKGFTNIEFGIISSLHCIYVSLPCVVNHLAVLSNT